MFLQRENSFVQLLLQDVTAIAAAVGATMTAVLKGHEAYQRFMQKKVQPQRKPPQMARTQNRPKQLSLFPEGD